jgi:hypothetical protein
MAKEPSSRVLVPTGEAQAFFMDYIDTYHRIIPERDAEASQKFLRDANVLSKLFSYE